MTEPRVPVRYRPHEPRHRFSRVHLDEVGVRVRVDAVPRTLRPVRPSTQRPLALRGPGRGVLDPVGISPLAELVGPPDAQLETNQALCPAKLLHADRIRARSTRQV